MRKSALVFVAVACSIVFGIAQAMEEPAPGSEKFVLYKLYDMAKNCAMEIKPLSEFRKLQAEISKEGALFQRALSLAEREWTKNKDKDEKGSFPRSIVAPRGLKEIDTFATQDKAQQRLTAIEERNKPSDKQPKKEPTQEEKAREAKKAAKDAERKSKAETTAAMVDTHLKELMAAQAGGGEKKPEEK
ncbi:MAG: hypothetical protein QME60_07545 [Verrucomicrobiota bacterium]|nr:hypothetical protein [Verrucomicrobiota bacterium]